MTRRAGEPDWLTRQAQTYELFKSQTEVQTFKQENHRPALHSFHPWCEAQRFALRLAPGMETAPRLQQRNAGWRLPTDVRRTVIHVVSHNAPCDRIEPLMYVAGSKVRGPGMLGTAQRAQCTTVQ